MKPTEFATFWNGPVDPLVYTCLASFAHHRAGLKVYTYDRALDLPPGIKVADAREIIADESCMTRYLVNGQPSLSRFANRFRYEMIRQTGACWVDGDMLCLAPPKLDGIDLIFGRQANGGGHAFNVAVLKLPAEHPMLAALIHEASHGIDLDSQPWGSLGPGLLTRLVRKYQLQPLARPQHDFYAVPHKQFWKFLLPEYRGEVEEMVGEASLVHLWNQKWNWFGCDKGMAPPPGSYLHQRCEELGTLPHFRGTHDAAHLRTLFRESIEAALAG